MAKQSSLDSFFGVPKTKRVQAQGTLNFQKKDEKEEKKNKTKNQVVVDDNNDEDDEDDDDVVVVVVKPSTKKQNKRRIIDDDDDDEEEVALEMEEPEEKKESPIDETPVVAAAAAAAAAAAVIKKEDIKKTPRTKKVKTSAPIVKKQEPNNDEEEEMIDVDDKEEDASDDEEAYDEEMESEEKSSIATSFFQKKTTTKKVNKTVVSKTTTGNNNETTEDSTTPSPSKEKELPKLVGPLPYVLFCDTMEQIEAISSRLEISDLLMTVMRRVIQSSNPTDLYDLVYLSSNSVAPSYDCIELGIGDAILIKAIGEAYGTNPCEYFIKYNMYVCILYVYYTIMKKGKALCIIYRRDTLTHHFFSFCYNTHTHTQKHTQPLLNKNTNPKEIWAQSPRRARANNAH